MCRLSEKLKLCTCDVGSVEQLDYYWVLHRFVRGQNRMVIGKVRIPDTLDPNVEAHNRSVLLARLNESDTFDVDLNPQDGDRLQMTFKLIGLTINYGYARAGGKWVEEPYDHLGWLWHHQEEDFGEVRSALKPPSEP